jgi:hypothetical protein
MTDGRADDYPEPIASLVRVFLDPAYRDPDLQRPLTWEDLDHEIFRRWADWCNHRVSPEDEHGQDAVPDVG